jgi:hypothetical protein
MINLDTGLQDAAVGMPIIASLLCRKNAGFWSACTLQVEHKLKLKVSWDFAGTLISLYHAL